jgi:hypothetical protein
LITEKRKLEQQHYHNHQYHHHHSPTSSLSLSPSFFDGAKRNLFDERNGNKNILTDGGGRPEERAAMLGDSSDDQAQWCHSIVKERFLWEPQDR